jgi:hypothetical protein
MGQELSYSQTRVLRDKIKQARQEQFLEQSRKRLDKIITTKMRTCFIGAIASFEEEFGFLWGHGKSDSELDEQEREMRKLWIATRTKILNASNNQLRAIKTELGNHVVSWNRYHMDLPVKPLKEENTDEEQGEFQG